MNILSINNLAKIGREDHLFRNVSFGLDEGEKAALIGRNGTGKSTMLKTIAGVLPADEGNVVVNKTAGISFLPQSPSFNPEDSIKDHIFKGDSPKLRTVRDYLDACGKLSCASSEEDNRRLDELSSRMDDGDLWNYEAQVKSILSVLGIGRMDLKMGELSGGMVKKVALAQVLVEDTKLLLLDEPTNHLDISTISWLQNYLKNTERTVLMVTHDRYFLDAVCTNIFEIDRKQVKLYQGNYSTYLEKKEVEAEIQQNTDRRIESVLRFERDWLMRGPCARGTKAKARIQRDMQLINREKFREEKGFSFEVKGRRLGGKVLVLDGISKNFSKAASDVPVIKDFSYTFTKGQRIGVFGDNGSGKSTFLNIVTGKVQSDTGSVDGGENTEFGYYNQNPTFPDLNMSVLEYIREAAESVTRTDGKTAGASIFLNEFGFEGKIQHSPLSSLSGGERKRLFLVRLLMKNPNFLVLDEPTNDFDIFTMNILEDFLLQYQGCILIVSHDRYFMDKIADSLFILEEDGSVSGFAGKCSEYIEYREEKKREEELRQRENSDARKEKKQENKKRKISFREQKEFEALEEEIAELESEKEVLEKKMSGEGGDFSQVASASKRYAEVSQILEEKYERWAELASLA